MLKRIVLIGICTGLAHLLSFFSVSFIVNNNASELFISKIADVESGIALMLAIMSFGLQQVAARDIVVKKNWKIVLLHTQESRFSMGFFLFLMGSIVYTFTNDAYYLVFLLAPLLALNTDYGLYGRGLSLQASFLSLVKVGIPSIMLICLALKSNFDFKFYIASVVLSWFIVGLASNRLLQSRVFVKPVVTFYKTYLKNSHIGFTDIVLTILNLGILSIAKPFYSETIIANSFIVLKLYVLVKGVQRVVFQAFYKDLIDKSKSFLIDKMGLIIAVVFFSATCLYPEDLILYVFSKDFLNAVPLLVLSGVTVLISSISISASPRMLLLNKDKNYIIAYLLAAVGALFFLLYIPNTSFNFYGIIGAILLGELILNSAFLVFLRRDFLKKERMFYLLEIGLVFFILFLIKHYFDFNSALLLSLLTIIFYGITFLLRHKKEFL